MNVVATKSNTPVMPEVPETFDVLSTNCVVNHGTVSLAVILTQTTTAAANCMFPAPLYQKVSAAPKQASDKDSHKAKVQRLSNTIVNRWLSGATVKH